ncbi:MAG TPA: type II toxin-antitoxin system RelE/ParE family toxin [Terracidiphilus sp.]|nr:type II toxin-antitoxin system RelE/ParE family toxin [Terracidiphilus sp.]
MRLELSRYVENDIEAIADFIAEESPERAVGLVREIWRKLLLIEEKPLIYQLRPEIGEGARIAVVGRYIILFRVIGEIVRIERVVYGGRDLPNLIA